MAGEEQDLEVAPLTAEELALRCLEVEAVARGDILEMQDGPSTQETTEPREDLTCAICLTATDFAALPCCDSATTADSTFQCCLECVMALCARGRGVERLLALCVRGGGTTQCPRCRAPLSVVVEWAQAVLATNTLESALVELAAEVAAQARHEADLAAARARLQRQALVAGRYERIESIGAGVVGTVYKVRVRDRDAWTNETLALKQIRFEDGEEGVPVAALREISLLTEIAHPNIVPLREALVVNDRLFLLMELMDCNLREYVSGHGALNQPTCALFTRQILEGLAHLHDRRILHRDLKPQNILVRRSDRRLKLADFGLSRAFARPRAFTHEVVTLWYRAPEILLGAEHYSTPVDVWSVGCVLAEMATPPYVTGAGAATPRALFPGDSEIDQLFRIFRVLGTPSDQDWPGVTRLPYYSPTFPSWPALRLDRAVPALAGPAADLLGRLLAYEPSARITARAALAHAFIDPHAADRAAAAEAARAAAEALVDDVNYDPNEGEFAVAALDRRPFGSARSAFTTPRRQKRVRLVTPPDEQLTPERDGSPLLQGLANLAALCDRSGARAPRYAMDNVHVVDYDNLFH